MSVQERLERSAGGRALLSVLIGVTLATVLVMQIPQSYLRGELMTLAGPYGNATGLDQNWSVFAPDPRRISLDVQARTVYSDGSTEVWRFPQSDDFIGVYHDYRWMKYMEVSHQERNQYLWRDLALWVGRQSERPQDVVRVDLVRRFHDLLPPGDGPLRSPWREFKYFTLPIESGPEEPAA